MSSKRESTIATIIQAQKKIMHALQESMAIEWLQLDLTMGHVKVLFVLQSSGAMPIGGLAERLQIGLPAASIAVDKLVQLDLVERHEDPSDRRRTFVQLAPKGEQLASRLHQGRNDQLRAWLLQLHDADFAALAQGLQALAEVASAEQVQTKV